jgi:DNA-binding CsgD family transcriptional regulator
MLGRACSGQFSVLAYEGEPGVGKSVVFEACLEAARERGMLTLVARGIEWESEYPLSALYQLLRPVAGERETLTPSASAALDVLFGGGQDASVDPMTLGAAVLEIVAEAAARGPVLVGVDDTHWIDSVSARALSFALHRLAADSVGVVLTRRLDHPDDFAGMWDWQRLAGLDAATVAALLSDASTVVDPTVAARLTEASSGNPLVLGELRRLFTADQLTGVTALPDPLPLGDRGRAAFGVRVLELPESTRTALALLAAAGTARIGVLDAALQALGLTRHDLVPAETAGIVELDPAAPAFRHPLWRSAALEVAEPAVRRQAHATLAEALLGVDPERRAWHLAAAAIGPDELVAQALEQAAARASERAGLQGAADALVRAVQLTPDPDMRAKRACSAALACYHAGQMSRSEEQVAIGGLSSDPEVRADAALMDARLAVWMGTAKTALPRVTAAIDERSAAGDGKRELAGLVNALVMSVALGEIAPAAQAAERIRTLQAALPFAAELALDGLVDNALILAGVAVGTKPDPSVLALLAATAAPLHPIVLPSTVQAMVWGQQLPAALELSNSLVNLLRQYSAVSALPYMLNVTSEAHWWSGDWATASAYNSEAMELADQTGAEVLSCYSRTLMARIAACQGRTDQMLEVATVACSEASRLGIEPAHGYVAHAYGLLSLGRRDPRAALRHLDKADQLAKELGIRAITPVPFVFDRVEAILGIGDLDAAEAALEEAAAMPGAQTFAWSQAATLRTRGKLASARGQWRAAREHLAEAVATPEVPPFEAGRNALALGFALIDEHAQQAVVHLHGARAIFHRLDALPWTEEAERGLSKVGVAVLPVGGTHFQTSGLTPKELQVCLAVAKGATNREVGATLFLSTKTIEYHLHHAYSKLQIRNRTELARLFRTEIQAGI